jgi:predicted O-methyltransferase YrrM
MHPLQEWSQIHAVPSSSLQTIQWLSKTLTLFQPALCREIGTAIWRWSLHIANTIRSRDGHLTSREVSYPSYHVARTHLDPRIYTNLTLYHHNILNIDMSLFTIWMLDRCFVDCHAITYLAVFKHISSYLCAQWIIIFDDMQTAMNKAPNLIHYIESTWRHTLSLPSENSDRILIASQDQTILDLLKPL